MSGGHRSDLGGHRVKAFLLPDFADDDPRRAHPQRLLDQAPKLDLASALETRLATLHADDVRQRNLESSNTSSAVTTRSRDGMADAKQLRRVVLTGDVPPQVRRSVAALYACGRRLVTSQW